MVKIFKTLVLVFVLAISAAPANALVADYIKIEGNQRVDENSIKAYMRISEGDDVSSSDVNQAIKALFATGLFSDVKVGQLPDGGIFVQVVENPIISRVAFEGNQGIADENLAQEVNLQSRSIYTKSAVQKNVQRLAEIYRKSGRYNAKIEPKVILKEQNRVDLVFEIDEGETVRIQKIAFVGNEAFDDDDLRAVVRSSEEVWYNFISSSDTYDPDRIEFDKELLRRHYTSSGYADFKVNTALAELSRDRKGFVLTFSIEEGAYYKFGEVNVESRLEEVKAENLDDEVIKTDSDEEYDAAQIERTIDNLVEEAGKLGFAFVEIDPIKTRKKNTVGEDVIDVKYVLREGPRVYVNRINIGGNSRTLDSVIRREMQLSEGDAYNSAKLKRSRQRVENLDFFSIVDVQREKGGAPDKVDINVDVKEKSTGEINFGAGFSTNDGVLGDVSITERNLLGRGQFLRLNVSASGRRQDGRISFTEPYFMGEDFSAGFDIFRTLREGEFDDSYESRSTGFSLRGGYDILDELRHNVFYTISNDEIEDVQSTASRFIRDQEGENVTSMVGHTFIYDTRDSRRDPREGYRLSFGQDFAGLGGDSTFIRHEAKGSYYYPVTDDKDWFLLFAGAYGNVTGIDDDVRINHRYFLGGKNFRGFDRGGVGPRDTSTDDALGGNNYYTLTTELAFPIPVTDEFDFSGALFAEAGSLWDVDDSGSDIVDSADPRLTVGFGLGWQSPFGPLRVDFGFPVVKDDEDETENFQLNFGTRF